MANFTVTPNMSLVLPIPGQEPGPTYATDQYNSGLIIDGHNHSAGSGVVINPNGLDINADLSIGGNNLTFVKTVNFAAEVSPLPGTSPNLGAVYMAGGELYYNDEAGNVVQITNSGSVNSGAGSITGLPSGTASASYSSGSKTFIWQSSTSTPANMDFGSAILRNIVASSKGLTLNPPTSMAADIVETLPTPPAVTSFMTMDNAGNMGVSIPVALGIADANIAEQTITQDKLALRSTGSTVGVGGYATSTASGAQTTTSTSLVDITNLTITITTTGRPVMLGLIGDGTFSNVASFEVSNSATGQGLGFVAFFQGSTQLNQIEMGSASSIAVNVFWPASSCVYIDTPVAGTYTYKVQWSVNQVQTTLALGNAVLFAYEI